MDYIVKIIRRYIWATLLISLLLIIVNVILLMTLVFNEINDAYSPEKTVENVSKSLNKDENDVYSLSSEEVIKLDDNNAWAMLINYNGNITWSHQLPGDIPQTYNLVDTAKFSRFYLNEYPVYTWEHIDGLIVVGYPKQSFWKYQIHFLTDWVKTLPLRLIFLLLINVAMAILISIAISSRIIKGIRPLIKGIQDLSLEKNIKLDNKGLFADLAENINRKSNELQKKTSIIKERDQARSNWIAGISHDIRTPLSTVLGHASDLENNIELTYEQKSQARIIRRQAEKLKTLVSDLNLVSMLEYEMQPLNLVDIRPSVLLRTIVSDYLNDGIENKFNFSLQIEANAEYIVADRKLLTRAVSNLIQNSIDHNPMGCNITIKTSVVADKHQYKITVKDNGKGISRNKLSELIELPYTLAKEDLSGESRGLGLPMVNRIVLAHQGCFIFNNRNEKGENGLESIIVLPIKDNLN